MQSFQALLNTRVLFNLESVQKTEPSNIVGGNTSWYSHCGRTRRFLKKLKIELPSDTEIPLLGIYLEGQKDTWTPMFIAALFHNNQDNEVT